MVDRRPQSGHSSRYIEKMWMFIAVFGLLVQTDQAPTPTKWFQSSLDGQTYQFLEDDPSTRSIRSASGEVVATLARKKPTDKFKGTTSRLAPSCPDGKAKIELIEVTDTRIRMRVEKPQQSMGGKMGCMMIALVMWENFELTPAKAPTQAPPVASSGVGPLPGAPSVKNPNESGSGRWMVKLSRPLEKKPLDFCIASIENRRDCIEIILAALAQKRRDIVSHWIYPVWLNSGWTNPEYAEIEPDSSPACGKFFGVWPLNTERNQGYLEYEKCWGSYHIDFSERGHLTDIRAGFGSIAYDMKYLGEQRPTQFSQVKSEISAAQSLLEFIAKGASVEEVRTAMAKYGDTRHDPAAYRQAVLSGSQELFGSSPAGTFERCYLLDATFDGNKLVNDEIYSSRLTLLFRCVFSGGERRFPFFINLEKNQRSVGDIAGNPAVSPRSRRPY